MQNVWFQKSRLHTFSYAKKEEKMTAVWTKKIKQEQPWRLTRLHSFPLRHCWRQQVEQIRKVGEWKSNIPSVAACTLYSFVSYKAASGRSPFSHLLLFLLPVLLLARPFRSSDSAIAQQTISASNGRSKRDRGPSSIFGFHIWTTASLRWEH